MTDLLLNTTPAGRHHSAEGTDWTDTWVCVGLAEQLTEVGAVLPATIGHHGVHVRRTGNGLLAAVNARPFGGCMSVPVHCGSTRNVRCPHLACAFSEDGGVLDSRSDPTGRARVEFVGDGRRSVTLPLAQWGTLLFVNVTLRRPGPLPIAAANVPDTLVTVGSGSRLEAGSWLTTPARVAAEVAAGLGHSGAEITVIAPNLAITQAGSDTVAALSRPAGQHRSTVVWAVLRDVS